MDVKGFFVVMAFLAIVVAFLAVVGLVLSGLINFIDAHACAKPFSVNWAVVCTVLYDR
jgi:hypothetical protein